MTILNTIDGSVLTVVQQFLDESTSAPMVPKAGFPQVRLLDTDGLMLSSITASPTLVPGEWTAALSIPNLGLLAKQELRVRWRFILPNGEKTLVTESVIVEPKVDARISDIVVMFGDLRTSFVIPMYFGAQDMGEYQIYKDNKSLFPQPILLTDTTISLTTMVDKTNVSMLVQVPEASLYPYLLRTTITPFGSHQRDYTYKMWAITPQIMLGMATLEDFLNKSRIENVIPELQYTSGDLVGYLERGLYMFNTLGNYPTFFTGTNMQGVIFDAWITCASYYALGAQLMAEGSLAFDFSGQGVSLNIDRTPALEGALGRIESAMDARVAPLKKQLSKQGIVGGDGSVGKGNMNNPTNIGTLSMINASTTRLRGVSNVFGRRF